MLVNAKPKDKKIYIENLSNLGFQFTTEAKSKIVSVQADEMEDLVRLLDVKDE